MTHGPDFFEECAERIFQEFTRFSTSSGIISKLSNITLFGTFSLIALSGALYKSCASIIDLIATTSSICTKQQQQCMQLRETHANLQLTLRLSYVGVYLHSQGVLVNFDRSSFYFSIHCVTTAFSFFGLHINQKCIEEQ